MFGTVGEGAEALEGDVVAVGFAVAGLVGPGVDGEAVGDAVVADSAGVEAEFGGALGLI